MKQKIRTEWGEYLDLPHSRDRVILGNHHQKRKYILSLVDWQAAEEEECLLVLDWNLNLCSPLVLFPLLFLVLFVFVSLSLLALLVLGVEAQVVIASVISLLQSIRYQRFLHSFSSFLFSSSLLFVIIFFVVLVMLLGYLGYFC